MPKREQDKKQTESAKQTHEQRSSVIVSQLLQTLGRPATLYRVEIRHLWEGNYRANVFVGGDAASVRIAHSFFLATGADGNILASVLDIKRKY